MRAVTDHGSDFRRPGMVHLAQWQKISAGHVPPVDFHLHTSWTDGRASVREMHAKAIECGLKAILFSEHVRKSSEGWFETFAAEIRSLSRVHCLPLVGVETKVEDFDGNIDCSTTMIENCDLVMASVHRFPDETGAGVREFDAVTPSEALDLEFRLGCAVLDNPAVTILGHPFGMCCVRYRITPPDELFHELIAKAARNGVAIEVSSKYHSDPWRLVRMCREHGAAVSLGSDAHNPEEIGRIVTMLLEEDPA